MDQFTLDQFPLDQLLDQFSNGRVLLDEYSANHLFGNCKLYKTIFLPLFIKELFILDHSSSL